MSNYATDIFQNYILNCYIYLHHNEITTSQFSTAQLLIQQQPRQCTGRSSFTFHRVAFLKTSIGKVAKQGRWGDRPGKRKVGLFILEHMQLVIVVRGGFYCSKLRKNPFFSFFPPLCYCSLKCMNVAGQCYIGCSCKLQYSITLQRCSVSICYHKFISYFLSFIKYTPTSLYK